MEMIKVRDNVRIDILTENIEPLYKDEIRNKISDNKCWRVTGSIFETLSKILISGGAILSFSSGYYNSPTLSFVSGSVSTISLAFLQFSSFSYIQNTKQSKELNILLKSLNLEPLPVVILSNDEESKDSSDLTHSSRTTSSSFCNVNAKKNLMEDTKKELV